LALYVDEHPRMVAAALDDRTASCNDVVVVSSGNFVVAAFVKHVRDRTSLGSLFCHWILATGPIWDRRLGILPLRSDGFEHEVAVQM